MVTVVTYNIGGDPIERGVYACRVPDDDFTGWYKDVFLAWHDGHWWHLRSDLRYRGEITGWIGPLQRDMKST